MKRLLPLLLTVSALALPACSSTPAEVTGIAFSQNVYTVSVGESFQLEVILFGGEKRVVYVSANEEILHVSETGLATALKKGEAMVLAICNDHVARCGVTIEGNGLSDCDVFGRKATLSINAELPALGIAGASTTNITYVYEDETSGRKYLETSTPKCDLLSSLSEFASSPFVQANPTFEIPALYDTFVSYVDQVQTGPFLTKTLIVESSDDTHFYDGDTYLGKESISEGIDFDVDSILNGLTDFLPALEDPTSLIAQIIALQSDSPALLELLFGLARDAKIDEEEIEGGTKTTITFGEKAGEALVTYFSDYDFGTTPKLSEATLAFTITDGEERALKDVSLSFQATINELENSCTATFKLNPEKTPYEKDFFMKTEESFHHK